MKKLAYLAASFAIPALTFAQSSVDSVQGLGNTIIDIINNVLVPLVFALAFIVFLWGVFQYFIAGADNEDKHKEGRQFVLWAIIGFVIIFTLWGLVNIVVSTLNLPAGGSASSQGLTPPSL